MGFLGVYEEISNFVPFGSDEDAIDCTHDLRKFKSKIPLLHRPEFIDYLAAMHYLWNDDIHPGNFGVTHAQSVTEDFATDPLVAIDFDRTALKFLADHKLLGPRWAENMDSVVGEGSFCCFDPENLNTTVFPNVGVPVEPESPFCHQPNNWPTTFYPKFLEHYPNREQLPETVQAAFQYIVETLASPETVQALFDSVLTGMEFPEAVPDIAAKREEFENTLKGLTQFFNDRTEALKKQLAQPSCAVKTPEGINTPATLAARPPTRRGTDPLEADNATPLVPIPSSDFVSPHKEGEATGAGYRGLRLFAIPTDGSLTAVEQSKYPVP